MTNLIKLTLNRKYVIEIDCKIDAKDAQAISNLSNFTELDLSYNMIGDEGCREIARMERLTILKLSSNNISNIGVGFLSQLGNIQ